MKAITQQRYGSAEVLEYTDVPRPVPKKGEVLVRVRAAGVDRGVWHLMTGVPYVVRPAIGLRAPREKVPGRDLAGVVAAVGAGVTRFEEGDEVFGIGAGAYAEYARAREGKLVHKPAGVDFGAAAATPFGGLTALQAIRDIGGIGAAGGAGRRVLVIGAGGGVGTAAVALAAAYGAHVTGVCSGGKADLVRSLGAAEIVDHTLQDLDTSGHGPRYDLVLDIAGNRPLGRLRRLLTPRGTLVIVGGEDGGRWFGGLGRTFLAPVRSLFTRQRLCMMVASENHRDLATLADLLADGTLRPPLEEALPLADAAKALHRLETGRVRGKLVLTVD
ncbi:NAD(P)-dependent alcohol dehydrogenase [Streptomyces alkaliterrae]|uniref:NAD(P)-dependent alcohol dehydrogenase n=1 Tax=Streptomyces alkaliterrae TaxID=2213162 RepID=A0A5P0YSK0_9ACTN|nr:NAD(P)-dependent alcohol dehydrogenase [Streptomyces alkaliterrae]MBB1254488.1 NAD(P)-dependent alcohol dehydrogenase [Streptomyces alkaliterrae]MBB1260357.1 NAD(P)-dependent alcohol dehydrogenase [Streptomyces alkaliterrae]MQS03303.1 zinc-binding dehydrogenase [Streptomyces alkaliterrae]